MRKRIVYTAAAVALLAMTACEGDATDTVDDTVTDTPPATEATEPADTTATTAADAETDTTVGVEDDLSELATRVQTEMMALQQEIESSQVAGDLQAAWTELEAEIAAAIESVQTEGAIDPSQIEAGIEEFESTLDAMGDDVEGELRSAWENFRSTLEQLMQ